MATAEEAANWIALESDDYDGLGGAKGFGWARASTEDVARGIQVSTGEAYRLLTAAARQGLVVHVKTGRKPLHGGRGMTREKEVGWALWEVHLGAQQDLARSGKMREPDARAIAFHAHSPELDEVARGDRVTGKVLVRAADAASVPVPPALRKKLNRPGTWAEAGISNVTDGEALYRQVRLAHGAILLPNISPSAAYYVWVLAPRSDTPLSSEGPYGPHPLKTAEQMARIAAQEGAHDRAVSRGRDPESESFCLERRYAARTGKRLA